MRAERRSLPRCGILGGLIVLILILYWLWPRSLHDEREAAKRTVVDLLTTNARFRTPPVQGIPSELMIPGLIEVLERHQSWPHRIYKKIYSLTPKALRLPAPRNYEMGAQHAVFLLRGYGAEATNAIPALIGELGLTNSWSGASAIHALGRIDSDDPRVVKALFRVLLANRSYYESVEAAVILGRGTNPPPQLRDPLWKLSQKRADYRVARLIGNLNQIHPDNLALCLEQAHHPQPSVRVVAAAALGQTRPVQTRIVVALLAAALDPAAEVAEAAIASLLNVAREANATGEMRLGCVQRVLERGNDRQRWDALEVLEELKAPAIAGIGAVLAQRTHPNPRVRARAATTLGRLGHATPEIIEALRDARQDPSVFVREAADQSLEELQKHHPTTPPAGP